DAIKRSPVDAKRFQGGSRASSGQGALLLQFRLKGPRIHPQGDQGFLDPEQPKFAADGRLLGGIGSRGSLDHQAKRFLLRGNGENRSSEVIVTGPLGLDAPVVALARVLEFL